VKKPAQASAFRPKPAAPAWAAREKPNFGVRFSANAALPSAKSGPKAAERRTGATHPSTIIETRAYRFRGSPTRRSTMADPKAAQQNVTQAIDA
jgi:hypothetical protein